MPMLPALVEGCRLSEEAAAAQPEAKRQRSVQLAQQKVEVVEHNTDQGLGTHELCQHLLQKHGDVCVPADPLAGAWRPSPDALHELALQWRQQALAKASSWAAKLRGKLAPREAVFSLLQHKEVRRGPALSPEAKAAALERIGGAMAQPGGLKLALLMLPHRDQHPLKNLGYLPDAGELTALLRLWTLGTAVRLLGVPCKVYALRDSRRYPCSWHVPAAVTRGYSEALHEMMEALSLDDVVELRDVEGAGEQESEEGFAMRASLHQAAYELELKAFMAELEPEREALLSSSSEAELRQRLLQLPSGEVLLPMVYPQLHSLPPSVWPAPGADGEVPPQSPSARRQLLGRLLAVFEPSSQPGEEAARRQLLWEAIVGGARYVATYRSRSAGLNAFGVDDVTALAPGALRLSIHHKGKGANHFAISVGNNPHRMPWNGCGELRYSRTEKGVVVDVKLAAEMWHSHKAVLPLPTGSSGSPGQSSQLAWRSYCARLEKAGQPFCFADAASLPPQVLPSPLAAAAAAAGNGGAAVCEEAAPQDAETTTVAGAAAAGAPGS